MTSPDALDTATAVVQRAQELAQTRWDEVDGPEAVAIAEAVAAAKGLLDAALLRTAERITDTNAVAEIGWASVKDFLTHLLGGHKGTGGGLVRAAAQLRELPQVQEALEDGRITLPQARAIAGQVHTLPRVPEFRAAVADRMLSLAAGGGHDASGLQTAFGEVVRELDPDAAIFDTEKQRSKDERSAHHQRRLTITEDGRGGIWFKGYGCVEDGEHIKATLFPLSAPVTTEPGACGGHASDPHGPLFDADGNRTQVPCPTPGCAHDGSDPRDAGARLWDAFVDACIRIRNGDELPRDHGSAVKVVVTIDHESLRQPVVTEARATKPKGARDERLERRSQRFREPAGLAARRPVPSTAANCARGSAARGTSDALAPSNAVRAARACRWPATPTTSSTGPTEATPASTTSCCSAATTTP